MLIGWFEEYNHKIKSSIWSCFVADFIRIFFIVSFSFYTPTTIKNNHNNYLQLYFDNISNIDLYQFIICIIASSIISSLVLIYVLLKIQMKMVDSILYLCYILFMVLE